MKKIAQIMMYQHAANIGVVELKGDCVLRVYNEKKSKFFLTRVPKKRKRVRVCVSVSLKACCCCCSTIVSPHFRWHTKGGSGRQRHLHGNGINYFALALLDKREFVCNKNLSRSSSSRKEEATKKKPKQSCQAAKREQKHPDVIAQHHAAKLFALLLFLFILLCSGAAAADDD